MIGFGVISSSAWDGRVLGVVVVGGDWCGDGWWLGSSDSSSILDLVGVYGYCFSFGVNPEHLDRCSSEDDVVPSCGGTSCFIGDSDSDDSGGYHLSLLPKEEESVEVD